MGHVQFNLIRKYLLVCVLASLIIAVSSAYLVDAPGKATDETRSSVTQSALSAVSGETLISTLPTTYDTYTYTHSDILIFSYTNGTQFEVYNSAAALVWSGTVDAGGHKGLTTGAGTYKIKGTNPYSVLIGDELVTYVMGYYAFDKDGKGLSTKIYTYQVDTSSWTSTDYRNFVVFAYNDDTSVTISNTVTGATIWSGILNTGQHHAEPTLSNVYITVTATKPVSALSYTDQGYYIPASSGTFMGKKFYSWVGRAGGWTHDLNIIAYSDSTSVNVTNTDTGALIWSGTLNAGKVKSIAFTTAQYVTISTDKDVNAGIFPFGSYSSAGYYYSVHAQDTSGTGIGTLFYYPAISGGKMVIFAFTNNTLVTVTNSAGGAIWSGYLNKGESHQLIPSTADVYKIVGTNLMAVVYDWGDNCGADFAPQYYATPTTPTVTLNQPNGGETWTVGSSQNITWVASGGTGSLSVNLYYSTTGVSGAYTTIATGIQNTGSYAWTVPNTPSTNAAVKVVVTDSVGNVASDTSNAVFTIKSAILDKVTVTINQIDNSSFDTITTFVTVTNQNGTPITGLTAANFTVSEGSLCTPSITVVPVSSTGRPVAIPMTVDYSGSMSAADIAAAKTGLKNFINLGAANDSFAILKFATDVEIVQVLTTNKTLLLNKVNGMPDSSYGYTSFYDAVYDAVTLVKSDSNRKAIIAFTDGDSNDDVHSLTETINYAKVNNVPVYTIGLGTVSASVLQQIANQTGGQYYYAPTSDKLTDIYLQISQNLVNQYQITYQTCNPARDGTLRNVTVRVTRAGLTGTDTRGYYAPTQGTHGPTLYATNATGVKGQETVVGIYLNNTFNPKAGAITYKVYYDETLLQAKSVTVASGGVAPNNLSSPFTVAYASAGGYPNGNAWLANVTFQPKKNIDTVTPIGLSLEELVDVAIPPKDLLPDTSVQNGSITIAKVYTATLYATNVTGISRNQTGTTGIYLNNSFNPKVGSATLKLYYNASIITAQSASIMSGGVVPTNLSSPITLAIATTTGIPNGNTWLANVTFRSEQNAETTSELGLVLTTLDDLTIPPQDVSDMTRIQNGTFKTGGGVQVNVVDGSGNPMTADRIALESGTGTLSVTGVNSYRFSSVPTGIYQVNVTKSGYIGVNTTISYTAGSMRVLTATMVTHAYQPTVILAESGVALSGMIRTPPEQLNAKRNETDLYNMTFSGGGVISVALEYPMRYQLNRPQLTSALPLVSEMRNGTFLWTTPSYTKTNATLIVTATPTAGQSFVRLQFTGGKLGDVYYDTKVTSTDSLYDLHYVVTNLRSLSTFDYADVNRDGKITSTDALYILHFVVGNVNEYYQAV